MRSRAEATNTRKSREITVSCFNVRRTGKCREKDEMTGGEKRRVTTGPALTQITDQFRWSTDAILTRHRIWREARQPASRRSAGFDQLRHRSPLEPVATDLCAYSTNARPYAIVTVCAYKVLGIVHQGK